MVSSCIGVKMEIDMSHDLLKPALMTKSSKFSWLHILNLQSIKKLSCTFYEVISIIHGNMVFWNFYTVLTLTRNVRNVMTLQMMSKLTS